jgi:hypothetical protein
VARLEAEGKIKLNFLSRRIISIRNRSRGPKSSLFCDFPRGRGDCDEAKEAGQMSWLERLAQKGN